MVRRAGEMARVIVGMTMSLDGFIAGPGDAMDWLFEHSEPSELAAEVIETTGALLVGRRTYEVEDRYRGGFYGGEWTGPYFVLTHEAPTDPPEWMTGTFVNESIDRAVVRAKSAAGAGKNVGILGADVARQCIDAGLLDEIVVHLSPVLLGDGVRLFEASGSGRIDLERTYVGRSGQLTDLRYRVGKEPAAPVGKVSKATNGLELEEIARNIIDSNLYMTIGTADQDGVPWATPVYYASAKYNEFLWVSSPEATHSRNLVTRPDVGIVIFDSRVPIGTGQGVYLSAVAEELTGEDILRGIEIFSRRSINHGGPRWTREDVVAPARHRLYRAAASKHFVLGPRDRRIQVNV